MGQLPEFPGERDTGPQEEVSRQGLRNMQHRECREQRPSHTGSLVHISLQASNTEANMQGDWTVQLLPQ